MSAFKLYIGVIGIHPDDDPRQLAANFCKIYHLNEEAEDALFKIILENLDNSEFHTLDPNRTKTNQDIDPIEEAREGDEQTSYQRHSNKSKSQANDYSKISYHTSKSNNTNKTSKSNSKINFTSNKNVVSQFCTPEQNEEILNSFNKHEQDGFDRSELDDHQMMMGEDVNYSPDSSVRIPHTSFTDEGAISERQNRFQQDRLSNIHGKVENKRTTAPKVKRDTQRILESVKEERESDSRVYNELDNSHTIEQFVEEEFKQSVSDRDDIDTEVIVAEIDSSDLERYGKIFVYSKVLQQFTN